MQSLKGKIAAITGSGIRRINHIFIESAKYSAAWNLGLNTFYMAFSGPVYKESPSARAYVRKVAMGDQTIPQAVNGSWPMRPYPPRGASIFSQWHLRPRYRRWFHGAASRLATALLTFLNFYSKDPIQSLRPRHRVGLVKRLIHLLLNICRLCWDNKFTELAMPWRCIMCRVTSCQFGSICHAESAVIQRCVFSRERTYGLDWLKNCTGLPSASSAINASTPVLTSIA